MIKIKYKAFTLSEVLITLTIVGILAAMVLPGLIKDTTNKANMALLQSTIAQVSNAVQQELTRKNAKYISETDIYNNPQKFLEDNLETAKSTNIFKTKNEKGEIVDIKYKSVNGDNAGASHPDGQVLLKNGVYIGLRGDISTLVIDLNGPEPPNVIGIDYFAAKIEKYDDISSGIRMGDVGAAQYNSNTDEDLQTDCKGGAAAKCYALVERSGFDPDYLEKDYTKAEEETNETDGK
ncbi:MAG: type II secretion system GspH family protein [Muribaculaceae bacterium]|nr:type II secretion system GspH family protein [Muribaculaceae bacterium]